MVTRMRSPFGAILREERRAQGISQSELASRVAERFASDPTVAELGVVSDRAISNIEAAKEHPEEFVRPRPETVRVLMTALGIDPSTERGQAMLRAADATHRREKAIPQQPDDIQFQIPFVQGGREQHWNALQDAWKVTQSGQPQIRLVEGTAGLGKTRLIEEFLNSVREESQDFLIASGDCSSGAANVEPYLPWRRAMSYAIRASMESREHTKSEDEFFAAAMLASVNKLGGVLIDLQDLQEWMTAWAPHRLPELKRIRESWSPTNTGGRYDQLISLVSNVASQMPVIIVLEDLHWADESSCSMLLHLQRQMRLQADMPVLVIGTYRASDLVIPGGRHPLLHVINEMARQLDSLVLSLENTIDVESGLSFVSDLVDTFLLDEDDRTQLIEMLHNRTHGHPLFTTELVQRLVETGALVQQPDRRWDLDKTKVAIELPNRMRAIIDERIQRLPNEARSLVEAASVQGGTFAIDVLPHVTGLSESEVDVLIDRELVERHHILRRNSDPTGLMYSFDHDIVAESVYESLSPYRKQALHRRTAESLIAVNQHNLMMAAPKAAHHYEQANMLTEAAEQALLASFAALAKLDHDLTMIWVDRSERLARAAGEDDSYWRARVRRAHVLRSMGTLLEARSIGYDAIAHAQRRGDISLEADASEVIALVAYDIGELDDATEAWSNAIQSFEQIGRKDRVSAAQSMLSHVACRTGRIDAAIRHAQAAWAAAPDATRDGLGAEALLAEGNAMMELGRLKDAIDLFSRSLSIYSFTGEMRGIILCRMNIALCHSELEFLDRAFADYEQLQKELTDLQTPRLHAYLYLYHGMAYEAAGDYVAARKHYELALATRKESGLLAMAGDDLAGMLRSAIGQGEGIQESLDALQAWWRANDPRALENPLLAMYSLVRAYEVLGNERLMTLTLNEGARFFLERANQIQNPAIREMYLRGHKSGKTLLNKAKEAGLVQM